MSHQYIFEVKSRRSRVVAPAETSVGLEKSKEVPSTCKAFVDNIVKITEIIKQLIPPMPSTLCSLQSSFCPHMAQLFIRFIYSNNIILL